MSVVYQVRDWNDYFENARSRTLLECSWVPMPNKQSGLGLSRILAEPDGAAIYGIWCLIVGAVSRQRKPRNGWLTADGYQAGTPWTPGDLALMFRRPAEEVERALAFLSSGPVGWIAVHGEYPSGTGEVSAECPPSAKKERKKERKKYPPSPRSGGVALVFECWVSKHWGGKGKRPMLDAKRARLIKARLKDGYSVEDLKQAIDGCALDPFSMGQNDRGQRYNDISLICRDAAHVDKFRAIAAGDAVDGITDEERERRMAEFNERWEENESGD